MSNWPTCPTPDCGGMLQVSPAHQGSEIVRAYCERCEAECLVSGDQVEMVPAEAIQARALAWERAEAKRLREAARKARRHAMEVIP